MRYLAPLLPLLAAIAWALAHFARFLWRHRGRSEWGHDRGGSPLLPASVRAWWFEEIAPLVGWLVRKGVRPNHVTFLGTAFAVLAGVAFAFGGFVWGGYALLAGGLCDILDGHVARASGQATLKGAYLDSTLDRYADMVVLIGLALAYRGSWVVLAPLLVLVGSVMTSYARARAEGLGLTCRSGLMQRPERIVILSAAALFGPALSWGLDALLGTGPDVVLPLALSVMAVLVNGTAAARIRSVYLDLKARDAPAAARATPAPAKPPTGGVRKTTPHPGRPH